MTADMAHVPRRLVMAPRGLAPGYQHVFPQVTPAAATGVTYTVGAQWWEIVTCVTCQFVTSATVANRTVTAEWLDSDGNILAVAASSPAIAASTTQQLSGWLGGSVQRQNVGTWAVFGIPEIVLQPGWQFSLALGNAQAADQLSAVVITVARYPEIWANGTAAEDAHRMLTELWETVTGGA